MAQKREMDGKILPVKRLDLTVSAQCCIPAAAAAASDQTPEPRAAHLSSIFDATTARAPR